VFLIPVSMSADSSDRRGMHPATITAGERIITLYCPSVRGPAHKSWSTSWGGGGNFGGVDNYIQVSSLETAGTESGVM
jgi:hypothetical protein